MTGAEKATWNRMRAALVRLGHQFQSSAEIFRESDYEPDDENAAYVMIGVCRATVDTMQKEARIAVHGIKEK